MVFDEGAPSVNGGEKVYRGAVEKFTTLGLG
jgi:hypothetical protein